MQKPEYPIESDERLDYGLSERVARHLEESSLHVWDAMVMTSMPAAIGDPDDPNASIFVALTLLTDGRRGWLVLVAATDEWDAEAEMTEFVDELRSTLDDPPPVVVRAAERYEPPARGVLDLRDAVRERLEAEFERHFGGAAATDVAAFLEPFAKCGYSLLDELMIRREMNQAA